ncbi:MAG: hypothetical protein ACKVOM_06190 [Ferruginibacter sp.]
MVRLNFNDLGKLSDTLAINFLSLSPSAMANGITDKTLNRQATEQAVTRLQKVFNRKAPMAGTTLLLNIVR